MTCNSYLFHLINLKIGQRSLERLVTPCCDTYAFALPGDGERPLMGCQQPGSSCNFTARTWQNIWQMRQNGSISLLSPGIMKFGIHVYHAKTHKKSSSHSFPHPKGSRCHTVVRSCLVLCFLSRHFWFILKSNSFPVLFWIVTLLSFQVTCPSSCVTGLIVSPDSWLCPPVPSSPMCSYSLRLPLSCASVSSFVAIPARVLDTRAIAIVLLSLVLIVFPQLSDYCL